MYSLVVKFNFFPGERVKLPYDYGTGLISSFAISTEEERMYRVNGIWFKEHQLEKYDKIKGKRKAS